MNIRHPFEIACTAPLRTFLRQPTNENSDYLLVSGLYLEKLRHSIMANKSNVFAMPLNPSNEAHEALNSISSWMKKHDVMNQNAIHGDNHYDYNITFTRMSAEDDSRLTVVRNFFLTDYLFDHCHPADARNFDELMHMLDRDKMAEEMLAVLKDEFSMTARDNAPLFWRRDMRQCSHPDHRRYMDAPKPERLPQLV